MISTKLFYRGFLSTLMSCYEKQLAICTSLYCCLAREISFGRKSAKKKSFFTQAIWPGPSVQTGERIRPGPSCLSCWAGNLLGFTLTTSYAPDAPYQLRTLVQLYLGSWRENIDFVTPVNFMLWNDIQNKLLSSCVIKKVKLIIYVNYRFDI